MSRSCITDKSEDVEWVEVTTQNLNSLKVDQEVRVNGVQTLITKLYLNDQKNVIGFYTSRDMFTESTPNNFWGKNSHSPYRVWVKGIKPQAKKDFICGKWYKCTNSDDGYLSLSVGKYYECKEDSSTRCQIINDVGNLEQYLVHRFDINSESDYDPNLTRYVPEIEKKVVAKDVEDSTIATTGKAKGEEFVVVCKGSFFDRLQNHLATNQSGNNATTNVGDVNMSNSNGNLNRVVSVKFFDDDAGLKAEHSLVAEYQVTTRVSDQMTISKVLLTEDVAGDIELHNGMRANTVDLHILKQTGNKVMLQPVEFEDLRVEVRQV